MINVTLKIKNSKARLGEKNVKVGFEGGEYQRDLKFLFLVNDSSSRVFKNDSRSDFS